MIYSYLINREPDKGGLAVSQGKTKMTSGLIIMWMVYLFFVFQSEIKELKKRVDMIERENHKIDEEEKKEGER